MAIFNQQSPAKKDPVPSFAPEPALTRDTPATPAYAANTPVARQPEREGKESLISADLTIEGKIEGAGHIRIAGKFKGDVNVQGDLSIERGAKVNGEVRAKKVIIAGELEGNIDSATRVELLDTGVMIGDLKASSLIVAAGSRMRGNVEFGWEDKASASGKSANGNGSGAENGPAS
ncbi:MAG: polymer-forming cytoskeletal protein [Pseudomonadota bacterium]|nr:polymer-forming cytoskeletal protein [Pseudomonadota bacterium]MDQ3229009.1 polymer-forming cytoskeletal protein [Pseudomonadota bacterium]